MKTKNWIFNGEEYDLSDFVKLHPGGKWVIEEARGTDITYLLQTNHLWTKTQALKRLAKYKIARSSSSSSRSGSGQQDIAKLGAGAIRWDDRLESIQQTLKKRGLDVIRTKVPAWGWCYYAVLGAVYTYLWLQWCMGTSVIASVALGLMAWLFAGFIQHEGGHSSLSRRPWINQLGRHFLVPWASPRVWYRRHSVMHHQFTNTKMDTDVQFMDKGPVRHHISAKWAPAMRFQIASLTLYSPIVQFMYQFSKVTALQFLLVFCHWLYHRSIFIAFLPFFSFGVCFLFVTQLNHIQEDCFSKELQVAPADFVAHQLSACVDYGHNNFLASFLSIWLNYQSYHHLFPSMSHFHFPHHKRLIDTVLAEHGQSINLRPVSTVIKDYYSYLVKLSTKD